MSLLISRHAYLLYLQKYILCGLLLNNNIILVMEKYLTWRILSMRFAAVRSIKYFLCMYICIYNVMIALRKRVSPR